MTTTLTYFEPLEDGHCTFWARMLLPAAARDPRVSRLRLVTGAEMARRLEDIVKELGVELVTLSDEQLGSLRQEALLPRGRAQWAMAREALEGVGGQLFLPVFDHAIFGAVVDRRPVPGQISGIIFRPPNGHNHPGTLKRRLDSARRWGTYLGAQRPALRRLFTLDETAPKAAVSNATGLLTFLPDPAPDTSLLEERIQTPREDGRRCYLLFGSLGVRKGIFAMLDALAHLSPQVREKMALRFVGRVLAQDREAFTAQLSQAREDYPEMALEWVDEFVSDETLAQEVVDCDVVLAPYQNHVGSSGVMFWATAAGKPLIGPRVGLLGYQLSHYNLGLAVDTGNPEALARALETVPARPRNEAFLRSHSPEAFTDTILDGVLS